MMQRPDVVGLIKVTQLTGQIKVRQLLMGSSFCCLKYAFYAGLHPFCFGAWMIFLPLLNLVEMPPAVESAEFAIAVFRLLRRFLVVTPSDLIQKGAVSAVVLIL